jgi:hypothetical protein
VNDEVSFVSIFTGGSMERNASVSTATLWSARIMSALPALFLLVDGAMKLVKPEPVVKATVELGYPESASSPSGSSCSLAPSSI